MKKMKTRVETLQMLSRLIVVLALLCIAPAQGEVRPSDEWTNYVNGSLIDGSTGLSDKKCPLRVVIERRITLFRSSTSVTDKVGLCTVYSHTRWTRKDSQSCPDAVFSPESGEMVRTWSIVPSKSSSAHKYKAKFQKCEGSPNCSADWVDRRDYDFDFRRNGHKIVKPDDLGFDPIFIPADELRKRSKLIVKDFINKLRESKSMDVQDFISNSTDIRLAESVRRYLTERTSAREDYQTKEAYLMSAKDAPKTSPQIVYAIHIDQTSNGGQTLETIELSNSKGSWKLDSLWSREIRE